MSDAVCAPTNVIGATTSRLAIAARRRECELTRPFAESCAVESSLYEDTRKSRRGRVEPGVLRVDPTLVIAGILERHRLLRDLERPEAVHHHGELVRLLRPDRCFGAA